MILRERKERDKSKSSCENKMKFSRRVLLYACRSHVYYTAKLFNSCPQSIRLLNDPDYLSKTSEYLNDAILLLNEGIFVYLKCIRAHNIKPEDRRSIDDNYLFVKANAIRCFAEANRYFILYDTSRHINRTYNGQCKTAELIDRIEGIGERLFRELSEVGYTKMKLHYPPKLFMKHSIEIKDYNLYLVSHAINIVNRKKLLWNKYN